MKHLLHKVLEDKMKILISSEISCDERGYPIYHKEYIDHIDIWPLGMTIQHISIENEIIRIDLKEDFIIEHIKLDKGNMYHIKKKNHIISKRVGRYALDRCFNCNKTDECKYLVGESTLIRH